MRRSAGDRDRFARESLDLGRTRIAGQRGELRDRLRDRRCDRFRFAAGKQQLATVTHDQNDNDENGDGDHAEHRAEQAPEQRVGHESHDGRSMPLDRNADDVALAVDGLDDTRRSSIVAQRLAQTAHAHVDAAIERIEVAAADEIEQLGARQ